MQVGPDEFPLAYSIGHSNQEIERFVELLQSSRIEVLVDVRTIPRSGYSPQFDGAVLKTALERFGIRYLFMGEQLGGRPADVKYYDAGGRVRYDALAESGAFREGILRIRKGMAQYRLAMMCSEENPRECHRYLLVSRVLERDGVRVLHIRGDGRVQTAAELEDEAARARGEAGQLPLFGGGEEAPWRSLQSVLQKRTRPSSSER